MKDLSRLNVACIKGLNGDDMTGLSDRIESFGCSVDSFDTIKELIRDTRAYEKCHILAADLQSLNRNEDILPLLEHSSLTILVCCQPECDSYGRVGQWVEGGRAILIDSTISRSALRSVFKRAAIYRTLISGTAVYPEYHQEYILQRVIDELPDLVWLKDIEGTYITCNKRFETFFGATQADIIGKNDYDFLPAEDVPFFRDHDRRALEAGGPRTNEETLNFKSDGHVEVVETIKTPIYDAFNHPYGVLGVARDITDRKKMADSLAVMNAELEKKVADRTEDFREAMEQAELANRAKSQFIANMSHEIRTPINAIVGMNYLLGTTEMTEKQQGYSQKIEQASEHLMNIISDILDFSKIEAGEMKMALTRFDLYEVVGQAVEQSRAKALKKGLNFESVIDEQLPQQFIGDPGKLQQVLSNFTENAVKFTEEGGVQVRLSKISEDQEGCHIRFEVTDTGIGMTPSQQEKIFKAFHQADPSITRQYGGTGLGLVISRQLIHMMDGMVTFRSEYKRGSTFTFELAFEVAERTEAVDQTPEQPMGIHSETKILLVEDNEINQQLIREIIVERGGRVSVAVDGLEALECLRQGVKVDMILMDLHMPKMDGFTAARRIREMDSCGEIPIIALTADVTDEAKKAVFDAGMNDYLSKPIRVRSLVQAIVQWEKH